MPTPPDGYVMHQLYVHPDDLTAWRRRAAEDGLTLAEWVRAVLNQTVGVPVRMTGRRKRVDGIELLSSVRLAPAVQRDASAHVALAAPPCDHVPRGGFCGRCGAVRA